MPDPKPRPTPEDALARLAEGNRRFLAGGSPVVNEPGSHRLVAAAQTPFAALLCCSDSRVSPEILFATGLGELFVVRNAGNTADNAATGSLEFAVAQLGVALIGVLGHDRCGAVEAAISVVERDARLPGAMGTMIAPIIPAAIAACRCGAKDPVRATAEENVRRVVEHLLARSQIIAEAARAGQIRVVGGIYDLDTGRVRILG